MSDTKAKSNTTVEKEFKERQEVMPLIRTPEDAQMAFLRQEISEDEFRKQIARFGVMPGVQFVNKPIPPDRQDVAFERKLPEDIVGEEPAKTEGTEYALKMVEAKAKVREEATKLAAKDDSIEKTHKREQNADWVHELEEKYLAFDPRTGDKASVAQRATPGKLSAAAAKKTTTTHRSTAAAPVGGGSVSKTATTTSHNK